MTAIWKSAKVRNIHMPFFWHATGAMISLSLSLSGLSVHFVNSHFKKKKNCQRTTSLRVFHMVSFKRAIYDWRDFFFLHFLCLCLLKEERYEQLSSYKTPFIKSITDGNYWLLTDRRFNLIDVASASHSEELNEHPFLSDSPILYSVLVCNFREVKIEQNGVSGALSYSPKV